MIEALKKLICAFFSRLVVRVASLVGAVDVPVQAEAAGGGAEARAGRVGCHLSDSEPVRVARLEEFARRVALLLALDVLLVVPGAHVGARHLESVCLLFVFVRGARRPAAIIVAAITASGCFWRLRRFAAAACSVVVAAVVVV